MDWEAGATLPNYVRAAANARLVGKQLAMLIQGLQKLGLSLHKVHLIGFSLGAHVAGFAGAELKNLSRITGKQGQLIKMLYLYNEREISEFTKV